MARDHARSPDAGHEPARGTRRSAGAGAGLAEARLSLVEPLRVLSVRSLPGADAAWLSMLQPDGVQGWPAPGRFEGGGAVRVVWCRPSEVWLVSQQADRLDPVARALKPGTRPDACAIDRSDGLAGVELQGVDIDGLLTRLMDASVIPMAPPLATRARCADLAVVLLRIAPDRMWLLVERPSLEHLRAWLAPAGTGLVSASA